MATWTAESVLETGLNATYRAASASDRVPPGSVLHVKNANASPTSVGLVTPKTVRGLAVADQAISVTNAQERFIAVPNDDTYIDPADGLVNVTFSVTASVTYAILRTV